MSNLSTTDHYGDPVNKTVIRKWMKDARECIADLERALKTNDWESARLIVSDLDPIGSEIRSRVEALADAAEWAETMEATA